MPGGVGTCEHVVASAGSLHFSTVVGTGTFTVMSPGSPQPVSPSAQAVTVTGPSTVSSLGSSGVPLSFVTVTTTTPPGVKSWPVTGTLPVGGIAGMSASAGGSATVSGVSVVPPDSSPVVTTVYSPGSVSAGIGYSIGPAVQVATVSSSDVSSVPLSSTAVPGVPRSPFASAHAVIGSPTGLSPSSTWIVTVSPGA